MSLAVEELRACLTQCQINEGLDPIFCQERCASYTPGDVGPGFWESFLGGVSADIRAIPSAASSDLQRLLILAIIAGVVLVAVQVT